MRERDFYVYIMTNDWNTVLYTGVTNNLQRRVLQHKSGQGGKFTRKYRVKKLVYFEATTEIEAAIMREKQLKAGPRRKKVELIEVENPGWRDLSRDIGL